LLHDSPIEIVIESVFSTSAAKRASTLAAERPCRRSVPERSRNASSIDSGSTSGVKARIICRTSRPTRAYFSMLGRTTRACGHSRSASNIGMAERTP
jgi:hypothetical protein